MTKLVYNYDENTKEYLNSAPVSLDIMRSKREGKNCYLLPANATLKEPLVATKGFVNIFNGTSWELAHDYRGKFVVNSEMEVTTITQIGNLPANSVLITDEQKVQIETDKDFYVVQDGQLIKNPNYDEIKAKKRQESFDKQFLTTTLGAYRLQPKGYSNAQQSIDTINNLVNAVGGLTQGIAQRVLFYQVPDFTKLEECTEEWLVAHQFSLTPMTKEDWVKFYLEFSKLYAQKQYMLEAANVE